MAHTALTIGTDRIRLPHLLSDTRYRDKTLQAIAAVLILTVLGWLISNTLTNMAALGKPISFGFLFDKAGYDINQSLIPYSPESSHLRAALTGLVNTLVVAAMGCATATVLGLFIGIARLSPNRPLAGLARVYVEVFRNVPVLLWLLLIFALITEALPPPSAFRGVDHTATMWLSDTIAVTNRGVFVPSLSFTTPGGAWMLVAAVIGAGACSFALARVADRRQLATGRRPGTWLPALGIWIALVGLAVVWSGPALTVPELKGFNFRGGVHLRNSLIALWLALSLYTAAFVAEIVRSGIAAVAKGQKEAAASLGLSPGQTMRLVVLPQAQRVIIPPLISQYLSLTKNSSLAIAVGYMDLTGTLMGITLNQTGRELEAVLLGMGFYLSVSAGVSMALNWYNARVQWKER